VRSYAEISRSQLAANYRALRAAVCPASGSSVEVLAVVKADAYGHGAVEVSRTLAAAGAGWFAVTEVGEGVELRQAGLAGRIVLLEECLGAEFDALAEFNLTPTVQSVEQLRELDAWARGRESPFRIHVEFDSGMGRLGLPEGCAAEAAGLLAASSGLRLEGLSTHFASSEDFGSGQTADQLARFRHLLEQFAARGLRPDVVHLANTAAVAYRPEAWGTMVRPGLALYGGVLPPVGAGIAPAFEVRPVLTWRARVLAVRDFGPGVPLGYGATYRTERSMRVGVAAAGYADGLSRRLSNGGPVLAGGYRTRLLGLVSMDSCLVDLTATPAVRPGDWVTLLGQDGAETLTAQDLADYAHTVPYEILCGLGRRVPRRYI
jgi:alanine racemase